MDGAFGGCFIRSHNPENSRLSMRAPRAEGLVQICVLYLLCSFKKVSVQSVMFCKRGFCSWVLMTFAVGLSLCLVAERSTTVSSSLL